MEQKLELKQTFVLSERMVQSFRILQMNTMDLQQYLNIVTIDNPVIEVEYEDGYSAFSSGREEISEGMDVSYEHRETLKEYLLKQWTQPLKPYLRMILQYILNGLDERGYFRERPEVTAALLNVKREDVVKILNQIQQLDPAGVGAADLKECLLLQAKRLDSHEKLEQLITDYLDLVAKKHLHRITEVLEISVHEAEGLCNQVKGMNPAPGSAFEQANEALTVIPDVLIKEYDGEYKPLLNEHYQIRISMNTYYLSLAKESDPETRSYLEHKIHQIEWIKACLEKRNQTLLRIAESIIIHQKAFFLKDDKIFSRMEMQTTARETGLHPSTISRAVRDKYLQCDKGIFPIRSFFTSGGKGEWSRSEIEVRLQTILDSEDPANPYSDRALSNILKEQGMSVSRRTVTKYRVSMGYKDSEGRRRY